MLQIRLAILVLLASLITSCSQLIKVKLANNTESVVTVQCYDRSVEIAPRKSKVFELNCSEFIIQLNANTKKYVVGQVPNDYSWSGHIPFAPTRKFKAQLESDGQIWLVRPKQRMPVGKFESQPTGWPLVPGAA